MQNRKKRAGQMSVFYSVDEPSIKSLDIPCSPFPFLFLVILSLRVSIEFVLIFSCFSLFDGFSFETPSLFSGWGASNPSPVSPQPNITQPKIPCMSPPLLVPLPAFFVLMVFVVEDMPGVPLTFHFLRANLSAKNDDRSTLGRLADNFEVFIRTETLRGTGSRYKSLPSTIPD
jgi:hypothetical protein